jgi:excisionase family DNA binding protein
MNITESSPPSTPPRLRTTEEIATHLAMSTRTLQELRDRGKIPFIRISSKCIRYNLAEVEKALGMTPAIGQPRLASGTPTK